VLVVPHHVAEISQAVEREIVESLLLRKEQSQARGAAHLAPLKLEHAVLWPPWSPATVEIAVVTATLAIDAAREPSVDHMSAKRLLD
jgi:hypothetical protein